MEKVHNTDNTAHTSAMFEVVSFLKHLVIPVDIFIFFMLIYLFSFCGLLCAFIKACYNVSIMDKKERWSLIKSLFINY